LVAGLAAASAATTAAGIYLTKGLAARATIWQTIGPLFAINALLVVPLIPGGGAWHTAQPAVLGIHLGSAALLVVSTAGIFALITRGSASAVAVAQALSPAAALLVAPLLLGSATSPARWVAVAAVMAGATLPLHNAFSGLGSRLALALMSTIAITSGLLTVMTGLLAAWGVGLPETYIVRAALAAGFYFVVAPPRHLSVRVLPKLAVRSVFITAGFLFAILAVQRGDVVFIQSVLSTTPILVILIESIATRTWPRPIVLTGATVVCVGAATLVWLG